MTASSATGDENISGSVEPLAGADDDYERAMQDAMALMEKGFPMGEIPKLDREALHERTPLRPRESR